MTLFIAGFVAGIVSFSVLIVVLGLYGMWIETGKLTKGNPK